MKDINFITGDLVLSRAKTNSTRKWYRNLLTKGISAITNSFWTHSGLIYVDEYGNVWVYEADKSGPMFTPFDIFEEKNHVKIERPEPFYTHKQLEKMKYYMLRETKERYDYFELLYAHFMLKLSGKWKGDVKGFTCGKLTAFIINQSGYMNIDNWERFTPADVDRLPFYELLWTNL